MYVLRRVCDMLETMSKYSVQLDVKVIGDQVNNCQKMIDKLQL